MTPGVCVPWYPWPMKLLSTWFLAARALTSASACASVTGAGSAIGRLRAMAWGTTASISARREAAPITESMCASSSGVGPMWRGTNSSARSRSCRGVWAVISMAGGLRCSSGRTGRQGLGRGWVALYSVFSKAS